MVVSPKAKPRVLSMIQEAAEPPCTAELQAMTTSDFDLAGPLPGDEGEVVVVRRKGTLDLYVMKAYAKTMLGVGKSPAAGRARAELEILRAITQHDLAFATKLYWSFQDVTAFFLVTVSRCGVRVACAERMGRRCVRAGTCAVWWSSGGRSRTTSPVCTQQNW